MQKYYRWCLTLRRLSWLYRLLIVLLSFVLLESFIVYLTILGRDRGVASILILSGILAALLFPWKRALTLEWGLLLVYLGINIFIKGWYDDLLLTYFIMGTCMDFFIVATIGGLWHGWELAEEAREKEQKLTKMRDQFIANVNHELRIPLTGASLGSLDILKDDDDLLNDRRREIFLDQAIYGCTEIQRITDNILDAMRADSDVSSPWIREFDLSRVIFDVLRHIDAFEHPLHIDIPEDVIVQGDSQQAGQVMRNLLSNCFKYSPKGTPVSIRIWRDDSYAYVCVRDKGSGIAPDHIPLIFQKFSRLECDVAGSIRGIGLGLYICRRFIENMGGRIWVESTGVDGEGSSFYFTMPCVVQRRQEVQIQRKGIA